MTTKREEVASAARADLAVAHILAASEIAESLYPRLLAAIGEALGWDFGALWEVSPDGETVHCVETWTSPSSRDAEFAALTMRTLLQRGEGLPGRVWASGEPDWIEDVTQDPNFPRAGGAAAAGVHSAFCFPIKSARGAIGAVEFFTAERREPDEELLDTMASLGSQLGQLIERRRAEREIEESNERRRAILEAALDCVITIDHGGRIIEFNPAAERTFGYSAAEAVGGDMAELIIPPSLRDRHRAGFARLLRTGEGRVLDRRLELTGMRADGSEFPAELTITRIDLPGPPMFSGYVRDITDRKRAEAELRASRTRLVEAGDQARRRLERDLHDGAQARLVNLGLALRLARARVDEDSGRAAAMLDEAIDELVETTAELREFARGIHPAVLSEGGLEPALSTLAARSSVRVELVEVPDRRFSDRLESTAYFVVAEALTNVARYAEATRAQVAIRVDAGRLRIEVRDDGRGGADPAAGTGLRGLADRVAALDGEFDVISPPGGGTTVRASFKCA